VEGTHAPLTVSATRAPGGVGQDQVVPVTGHVQSALRRTEAAHRLGSAGLAHRSQVVLAMSIACGSVSVP
jgi:hypothetical protein